jgi:hypothetical protein
MRRPNRFFVKKCVGAAVLFAVIGASMSTVRVTASGGCHNVSGKGVWTLIPSPNDPIGRTLGPTSGSMRGSTSAYLTSLTPNPDGSLGNTTVESWVLDAQDVIQFAGVGTFTPLPGEPIGTVSDARTLTAVGGTGKYAGATGTLNVRGIGFNLFGPNAGPGSTFFDVRFEGTICTPN